MEITCRGAFAVCTYHFVPYAGYPLVSSDSWSGITESDMRDVTKTFEEMQKDLLDIFNDKTVLVGHCISSTF